MQTFDVDGVPLFLLTTDEAAAALRDGSFAGVPLVKPEFLRAHRDVSLGFPSFVLALGRPSGAGLSWVVVHVVEVDDGWARVRVEGVTCFSCKRSVMLGNPLDYQIYEGVADPMAALANARRRPRVGCPGCGHALPRPAIVARLRAAA